MTSVFARARKHSHAQTHTQFEKHVDTTNKLFKYKLLAFVMAKIIFHRGFHRRFH